MPALALGIGFGCGHGLEARPGAGAAGSVAPWPSDAPRDLAPGKLLVARRQVAGPSFVESVVLLLDHGPGGALGLIVNRPTRVALSRLLPELPELGERSDRVWYGGPVERLERVLLLVRAEAPPPESQRVIPGVYSSTSLETLRALLRARAEPERFHAYLGYAGWAPGQLENEMARGDWFVLPATADDVFREDPAALWPELIEWSTGLRVRHGTATPAA